jgi:hypothetical protein
MALEDFKGKMDFLGGSRCICGVFEWLEALARKDKGSCDVWGTLVDFWSV